MCNFSFYAGILHHFRGDLQGKLNIPVNNAEAIYDLQAKVSRIAEAADPETGRFVFPWRSFFHELLDEYFLDPNPPLDWSRRWRIRRWSV